MAYAIIASEPGGTEVLRKMNIDIPVPSKTDVLIRQTVVGANFHEVYMRSGLYPWPAKKDLFTVNRGWLECASQDLFDAVGSGL